ncbi:MAG: hypothetical protein K2M16_02325 [Muribaculaceae bacterium]|nr:hypothetical protein [Muribaculaceae bacterium]
MKVSLAPYMPIILDYSSYEEAFRNLCLFNLPNYVTLYVPGKWDEQLVESNDIMASYEMFRLLLELPVVEVPPNDKSAYIKVIPAVLENMSNQDRNSVCRQLYALMSVADSRRIFAGVDSHTDCLEILSDKRTAVIGHFNPFEEITLLSLLESFIPRLEQLKHFHENRRVGNKAVAAFSAYDRNDESYAKKLLMTAFTDHEGDVDDRTYLYTYDKKNKTFVEFRPGRNNVYHGMDISLEEARKKAPLIVRKFHK